MDGVDVHWVEDLREQNKKGILYWQLEQQMNTVGCRYEALRQVLPEDQQKILDEYDRLRKRMEVCVTHTAYMIGIDHGKKRR